MTAATLEALRSSIPEQAKDIKLNLQAVLQTNTLSREQKWGVAIASAVAARNLALSAAVLVEARREVGEDVVDDALAAAALMAMNNVFYRFRHMVGKPIYAEKAARLRMNRLVKPATNKTDFELFSLAVSAINGCETCIRSHEAAVVVAGGLTEDHVHDAIRIAATMQATAVALEVAELTASTELIQSSSPSVPPG
jgi:alkyl hydroperoxide reductase subunit D